MKPSFLLPVVLTLTFGTTVGIADVLPSVTVSLAGMEIQNGVKLSGTSANTIAAGQQYNYAITGTVRGTGDFAAAIPPGTTVQAALDTLNAESFPLRGSVLNLKRRPLPVTFLKEKLDGSVLLQEVAFHVGAKASATIARDGGVKFGIKKVSITADNERGQARPNDSSLVFEDGSTLTVSQATATTDAAQPDFILPAGAGNDVYEDPAATQVIALRSPVRIPKIFSFYVQNDSTTAREYSLSLPTDQFEQLSVKYFISGKEVSGLASITLESLEAVEIKVKATLSASSPFFDPVSVSPRVSNGSLEDRIRISVRRQ